MHEQVKSIVSVTFILTCLNPWGETLQLDNRWQKSPNAIRAGKQRFVQNCGACHGSSAAGGRGPKLADSSHIREISDKKIFDIIQNGIPGTEMPSNRLPDQQIWEIVSFVRSLNAVAIHQFVAGNSESGRALFFGEARCTKCHSIEGHGGTSGPDLSDIASRRSAQKIKQAIIAPSQFIEPGFAVAIVVMTTGEHLEGVVKNESAYSIQLQDLKGNFHSVAKSDVSEIIRRPDSLMPATTLSHKQLQDILAFLSQGRHSTER